MIYTLDDFVREYSKICGMGWIRTHRSGPTGIGKTLEDLLGIVENNIDGPDFGDYELKSCRLDSNSMLTIFTKTPQPQGAANTLRMTFGYSSDAYDNDEKVLHSTLSADRFVSIADTGRSLKVVCGPEKISIIAEDGIEYAYWTRDQLKKAFEKKYKNKFVYAKAQSRGSGASEEFRFVEAYEVSGFNYEAFESFSKIWMERHERFLSPNTQYGDLNILKNRLIPYFGSVNVSKINAAQVIAFVDEINTHKERLDRRKGKLSAASVYAIFKLLRSMLNKAQEWGYIASNPCNEIPKDKIPKKIYDCPGIMEYDQLEKFLQKLFSLSENATNTKHQLFLYLSLIDGGRRGEHVALTWNDIDFEQKTIIISKGTYEEKGVTKVKSTKSGKVRIAYFDGFALELLKKHKMYQDEWLKKYNLTNPAQYVFLKTRIDRVEMPTRAMFGHWLTAFLKKNGMAHIGIHGFRRMAASYALCNHVPLTAVKDMLGHSDVATTNKYLRNLERARRDGVKTMSNVFQDMIKKDDKNNE